LEEYKLLAGARLFILPFSMTVLRRSELATNVTVKGQVTLPKAVREAVGIRPGDRVNVRVRPEGGVIVEAEAAVKNEQAYASRLEEMSRRRPIRCLSTEDFMRMRRRRLIFVDTNILIDIATGKPAWADWSRRAIDVRSRPRFLLFGQGVAHPSKPFPRKTDIFLPIRRPRGLIDPNRSGQRTAAPGEKGQVRNPVRKSLVTH
jgi:AbrB family looped-hinge helix DNA binding protein